MFLPCKMSTVYNWVMCSCVVNILHLEQTHGIWIRVGHKSRYLDYSEDYIYIYIFFFFCTEHVGTQYLFETDYQNIYIWCRNKTYHTIWALKLKYLCWCDMWFMQFLERSNIFHENDIKDIYNWHILFTLDIPFHREVRKLSGYPFCQ